MTEYELLPYSTLNILGSWRIEGLNVSSETIKDMYALSFGVVNIEEAIHNVLERVLDEK